MEYLRCAVSESFLSLYELSLSGIFPRNHSHVSSESSLGGASEVLCPRSCSEVLYFSEVSVSILGLSFGLLSLFRSAFSLSYLGCAL